MVKDLVSIVLPAFNSGHTIEKAIKSVVYQSYKNWELIVIDDGSTDNTEELIKALTINNLVYHKFSSNRGRGAARQKGLELANGEFLAMVDADDWLAPDKLELQIAVFRQYPGLSLVATRLGILDENQNLVGSSSNSYSTDAVLTFRSINQPHLPHACSMIRMNQAKKYNFDERLLLGQDTDFLIRLMLNKKFMVLNEILYYYTEIESRTISKVNNAISFNIMMYAKHIKQFPVYALLGIIKLFAKQSIYRILYILGLYRTFQKSKAYLVEDSEINVFEQRKKLLKKVILY